MKRLSKEELFERAGKEDISILSDPNVSKVRDNGGDTPLHYLAWREKIEILKHPDVAKVKNNYGQIPLHWLASAGKIEVLKHPDVDIVKDNRGITPFDLLCIRMENKDKYTKNYLKHIMKLLQRKQK